MKNKHGIYLWILIRMTALARRFAELGHKPHCERTYNEEFTGLGADQVLKQTVSRLMKVVVADLCSSPRKGVDMISAMYLSRAIGKYVSHSPDLYGKILSPDQQNEERKKAAHILGLLMAQSVTEAKGAINDDGTALMIGAASGGCPDVFSWLFSRSLHARAMKEGFKVDETGKASHKEIDAQVEKITNLIFDTDAKTVRPQLTAKALEIVAASLSATSDVPDMLNLHVRVKKESNNSPNGSEPSEETKKLLMKRMNRIEALCAQVAEESKRAIVDTNIGNPDAIAEFVMKECGRRMAVVMQELEENRGESWK